MNRKKACSYEGSKVIGLVIWWPGRVRKGFTFHKNASWKGKNYDLHKLLGFFSSGLVILVALTGAYFPFKEQYEQIASFITHTPHTIPSPKLKTASNRIASLEVAYWQACQISGENTLLRFLQKPIDHFSCGSYCRMIGAGLAILTCTCTGIREKS